MLIELVFNRGFNVVDKMEKFFAYQKDSRIPCKYGRKCFQTNKEHEDKYKHPPTKVRYFKNECIV